MYKIETYPQDVQDAYAGLALKSEVASKAARAWFESYGVAMSLLILAFKFFLPSLLWIVAYILPVIFVIVGICLVVNSRKADKEMDAFKCSLLYI